MKISVGEERELILEEVYSGVLLKTREGDAIGVCIRDGTFEINIISKGSKERNWWIINWQEGTIERSGPQYTDREALTYLLSFIDDELPIINKTVLWNYAEDKWTDPHMLEENLPLVLAISKEVAFGKSVRFNESLVIVQALLDSQNPNNAVTNCDGT